LLVIIKQFSLCVSDENDEIIQKRDTTIEKFNVDEENKISRDDANQFIFTGMQILNRKVFKKTEKTIFSMNEIWNNLISEKNILGLKSKQKFYHLNSKKAYEELLKKKIID